MFFFNTSGELYSINFQTQKINWVLNFKNSSLAGDAELFLSQPIVIKNNNLIVTTEKAVLSFNSITSLRNWNLSAEPVVKPIITTNYTYIVLKNYFLICIDNTSGDVVWSKNILTNIENKKVKKFFKTIIDFKIANNEINIFSNKGYLLSFNPSTGALNYLSRISKNGISSKVFFLKNNMFFVDKKNKLLKFN